MRLTIQKKILGVANDMNVTVIASGIILFLSACINADWLDGDIGVDRRNGDLPNMPIPFNSSQTPADCAKMCINNTDCLAWAYCIPNCGGHKQPSCYLKGNVTTQSSNPCRVSYERLQCCRTALIVNGAFMN